MTGERLASGLGKDVYSPPLNESAVTELATVFDFQSGAHVTHETIQYLVERSEFEVQWLEVLGKSPVPCTLIWGQKDPVAVPAVADYAWDNYLKNRKTATAEYIKIPEANHYVQHDATIQIAEIVKKALN
jgi:pimeloyl-ACP methyl ester carboxylesterase